MDRKEIALNNLIVKATVGSTVHGTNLPDHSDNDEMGVCIEPPSHVVGLENFENYVHRDKPDGVKSEAGDTDLSVYSLRKFVRLCLGGNPSALVLLYVPDEFATVLEHYYWLPFKLNRHMFVSQRAGKAFLGYSLQQRLRMEGKLGRIGVHRPELEAEFGYDTKYAGHMLGLGYQGALYTLSGKIRLPMPKPQRERILDVRMGKVPLAAVLEEVEELEEVIRGRLKSLPPEGDYVKANRLLCETYFRWWNHSDTALEGMNLAL